MLKSIKANINIFLLLFVFILLFSNCKISRHVPEGKYLLKSQSVSGIDNSELTAEVEQTFRYKPNRKILGVSKFYLAAYNFGADAKNDSSKFRSYFKDKVGEAPVVLDTTLVEQNMKSIDQFLFNKGYFDAQTTYEVKIKKRKRKAIVKYKVVMNERYYIRNYSISVSDRKLYFQILNDSDNYIIKPRRRFTTDLISKERERITKFLKDTGYYQFNREYIVFDVDSNIQGNFVDIELNIRNPGAYVTHQKYTIGKIEANIRNSLLDSVLKQENIFFTGVDETDSMGKKVSLSGYRVNPSIIRQSIVVDSGHIFRQKDMDNTFSRLSALNIFRSVNITVVEDTTNFILDIIIDMIPYKRQEIIVEPQALSSEQSNAIQSGNMRNYGLGVSTIYRNKNIFKNAEVFELRERSSIEGQFNRNDTVNLFNIQEHSLTASLFLPKIYLFKKFENSDETQSSRSEFSNSYIYETNIDFTRNIFLVGYNESFTRKLYSFIITPIEISYNNTTPKRDFLSFVKPEDSIFIANLFTTNLITNTRVIFVYNDKAKRKDEGYFFSRTMLESAGNILNAVYHLSNEVKSSNDYYTLLDVKFEQYFKIDQDFRYAKDYRRGRIWASRFHTGAGFAYGNSNYMPYVRRYFIGGANSLRGWRPRNIGPGSYSTQGFRADRTGEFIMEGQSEYRFRMINKLLLGALFIDAGNIWNINNVNGKDGAQFKVSTFYKQLAIDAGIGLRFDFNFFIFRFDFGWPIHNPMLSQDERWVVIKNYYTPNRFFRAVNINFGVGYPF